MNSSLVGESWQEVLQVVECLLFECRNNYNQVGVTFFIPLCSVFLASTSRLMELCLLLLHQVLLVFLVSASLFLSISKL